MIHQIRTEVSANLSSSYWNQWSRAEIVSMQGLEISTYQHDIDHNDSIAEGEPEHRCSGCMDCLGFSWSDFM